jgi:hypothetical protein
MLTTLTHSYTQTSFLVIFPEGLGEEEGSMSGNGLAREINMKILLPITKSSEVVSSPHGTQWGLELPDNLH